MTENDAIKLMIDNGFNSTRVISKIVKKNFDLDEISQIILGVIAENGPLNANQILKKSCNKDHNISREEVNGRLAKALKDFLIKKEGEIFRNTGKREKFYHLTFKGAIASLCRTAFEENYVIKKYSKVLSQYANKYDIPEITIQLIKYNLALYLIKNVIDGSKLTDSNNIDDKIFKLNSHKSLTEPNLRQKPISDKRAEADEFEIKTRLQIIQQILTQTMKNISLEYKSHTKQNRKNPTNDFIRNILPDYIKYWFDYIQEIQFGEIDELKQHIILDDDNFREKQIDIKNTNKEARIILNDLGIKTRFTDNEVPLFFL